MSHVTRVNIQIKDLAALALACERLGLTLNIGQKKYKWYGHFVGDYREAGVNPAEMGKCDHAISVNGNQSAYEIGVAAKRDSSGAYELRYDFWGGGYGLEAIVGKKCSKLVEEYTKIVAIKEAIKIAQSQGYQISTHENPMTKEVIIIMSNYAGERKITLSPPTSVPSVKKTIAKKSSNTIKQPAMQSPNVPNSNVVASDIQAGPSTVEDEQLIKLKVEGCNGDSCKELTRTLEEAMGIVAETENTDEFYAQDTNELQDEATA